MRGTTWALVLWLTAAGWASDPRYVGQYEVFMVEKGKKVPNSTLPPGQVLWLEIRKNGTWEMANMLSGWSGSWKVWKGEVVLITLAGPAGKVPKPEKLSFVPRSDPKRLELVTKGGGNGLELVYNPKAREQIGKRMAEALKRVPPPK